MEKIALNLSKRDCLTKSFAGQEIKIIPYINLEDVILTVDSIVNQLIEEKEDSELFNVSDKLVALVRFNQFIIDSFTNIDVDSLDFEVYSTSGIIEYATKFISNYDIAKDLLFSAISEYNQSMTLIALFGGLPSMEATDKSTQEMNEILSGISEEKLKMATSGIVNKVAHEMSKPHKKSKKKS